ncbi:hypothetical protein SLS62_000264 [Diatrype stigma]|uniref:PBSP domain-containing protein n=1 Tax=Diatrype stigma TaxID=117547 RepID=A0AAN9V1K8_9PEZI
MPLPPLTTPVPLPVFMPGMSHRAEGPPPPGAEPSPLPIRTKANTNTTSDSSSDNSTSISGTPNSGSSSSSAPVDKPFPLPKLRLQINDLSHAGSTIFLSAVDASSVLASGVQTVLRALYGSPDSKKDCSNPPPTRSVTLILRDMDGVAYTTGSDLDSDHKEIHFSLRYIAGINPASRQTHEITGVLVHELVHCSNPQTQVQHNGHNTSPGGLVEGVADFVRLRAGLAPPHWRRGDPSATRWDAGYQHTAFFLDWLDERQPEQKQEPEQGQEAGENGGKRSGGLVRRLNEKLRAGRYVESAFWPELTGRPVADLWREYREEVLRG